MPKAYPKQVMLAPGWQMWVFQIFDENWDKSFRIWLSNIHELPYWYLIHGARVFLGRPITFCHAFTWAFHLLIGHPRDSFSIKKNDWNFYKYKTSWSSKASFLIFCRSFYRATNNYSAISRSSPIFKKTSLSLRVKKNCSFSLPFYPMMSSENESPPFA